MPSVIRFLIEWNDTAADYPKDKCIHQLFEEQVERTPDAIAVQFDGQMTYRELKCASQSAGALLTRTRSWPGEVGRHLC